MLVAIPLFERSPRWMPSAPTKCCNEFRRSTWCSSGISAAKCAATTGCSGMTVDKAFAELTRPDVVVFPGGIGTRVLINDAEVLDWVREAHKHSWFTTSVCTGGLVLAAAGC